MEEDIPDSVLYVSNVLSDIYSKQDSKNIINFFEEETLFFNYAENPTSKFNQLIDGNSIQQKARFIFGTQFIDIVDIVFHDPSYQFTSLDWKAWKLISMLDEPGIEELKSPRNSTTCEESISLPTFNTFLISCRQMVGKQAANEIKNLCSARVYGSQRKIHSYDDKTKRKSLVLSIFNKKDKQTDKHSEKIHKIVSPSRYKEKSPPLLRKRRATSHKKLELVPPPFKKADSSSNLDALDLNSNSILLDEARENKGTKIEIPSIDTIPVRKKSSMSAMTSRFSSKGTLKIVSEIVINELHKEQQSLTQWCNVIPDNDTPQLIQETENYRIEIGGVNHSNEPLLVNSHKHTEIIQSHIDFPFFEDKIRKIYHKNYIGLDGDGNLVLLAMSREKISPTSLIIVHTIDKTYKYAVSKNYNPKDIVKAVQNKLLQYKIPSLIRSRDTEIDDAISRIEKSYRVQRYKFGVLYCSKGQTEENAMFSNNKPSKDYLKFIKFLGEEVKLNGWQRYAGGLDTRQNTTGTHSIFTSYRGYEIMFHVSTMLPFVKTDEQKLERKRHLGNDVVVIVYKEGKQKFNPQAIHSMFNHIFIVIQKINKDEYRIEICYKGDIPHPALPLLPENPVFSLGETFHNFLLTKLINSERVAMLSSQFCGKLMRTRKLIMEDLKTDCKNLLDTRRKSFG